MNMGRLIEVKDLRVSFPHGGEVIHGINFHIDQGEILGIVGESGSGKSVTSHAIMRLLDRHVLLQGSIHLSNHGDLLNLPEKQMTKIRGKEISMIFQEPMSSLNPTHRCGDQVLEALLTHQKLEKSQAKRRVLDLFDKVMLPDLERIYSSYPHELSGGQLQRVMISMAMINLPKLIIADEPTTALDVTVQKGIVELLKKIRDEHQISIIFISHDLGVIKHIADRVMVMQKGSIVEQGETKKLFADPINDYTKGLIACRPPLDFRLKRLPIVQDFVGLETSIDQYLHGLREDVEDWKIHQASIQQRPHILEVSHLNKWYPSQSTWWGKVKSYNKAVQDVSFHIHKGEVLGLVGESGSGKSTIGKSILRLIEPTSGEVYFNGNPITNLDSTKMRMLRKEMQIIFQDPYASLNPRMKVGHAIQEPMQIHGLHVNAKAQKEKVIELLEAVELSADHYDRYPHQFSGGQRQRICIARTLSVEPSFIVCDESVSALDVSVQAQILNLLKSLKEDFNLSYLFISHDISVIKFLCDRVIVLKDGAVVEENDVESIYQHPLHPYTQKLIDAVYI